MYPDLRHFNQIFTGMHWMNVEKFETLLKLVAPKITKKVDVYAGTYFCRAKTHFDTHLSFKTVSLYSY